jgi:tetratricopeptide (TPR) repeat protein
MNYFIQALLLFLLVPQVFADANQSEYVGGNVCKSCHTKQYALWQGSHHDLAMAHANDNSVLGDFSNTTFDYAGITSRFYKKDKKFMVRTDGADGGMHEYEIKYTFGVTPLQQYLIELEGGRMQALSIAWDSRDIKDGGQRWFHLYPDEKINYKDELHWTRPSFNWNGMCAECHSTNLQKNYDSKTDSFKTSWSEIDVSCEACHGPASKHVDWAKTLNGSEIKESDENSGFGFLLDERKNISWVMDKKSGTAKRSHRRESEKEIEVCAQCHSRRSSITDSYQPGKSFADHYLTRLLDENMYFPDGQIQDEVYVYGSFLQSKMYHKGVTCSDCHEPHSLELRHDDNGACLQCHESEKFNSKKHHFHKEGSTGALCAECHMPTRDYMVIDPRHDHSIRIPRPDLSVTLSTPNACNQCHEDKDATWADKKVRQWYGKSSTGHQRYARALDAGRQGKAGGGDLLVEQIRRIETPDIARASAIHIITPYLDQSNIDVLEKALKDSNAMVRSASVSALEGLPQSLLVQLAFPLLDDPVRSVRIEAARVLAPIPVGQLKAEKLAQYNRAAKEYVKSQTVNAERPEAQLNLGNYYAVKGDFSKSINAYKKAIRLEDVFIPAYINLSDLYRKQKNDVGAEKVLRAAIKAVPVSADAHYALGLSLIRQKKNTEAVGVLQKATDFNPSNAHYVYVYAVALNSTGNNKQAIEILQVANVRFPQNTNILEALVAFHRDVGDEIAAQTYMKKLQEMK